MTLEIDEIERKFLIDCMIMASREGYYYNGDLGNSSYDSNWDSCKVGESVAKKLGATKHQVDEIYRGY